jgi:ABC-type transporter MlaC component
VIVDFSVAGMWLAPEERDQFTAFLNQNGGSIPALIAHLDALRAKLGDGR